MHHDYASFALDGTQAERAIAAGTGEDDANGSLVLVLCERAKKEIYRQAHASWLCGFE